VALPKLLLGFLVIIVVVDLILPIRAWFHPSGNIYSVNS